MSVFGSPSAYEMAHKHMLKVQECVGQLPPMLEAFAERNYDRVAEIFSEISRMEEEANALDAGIRQELQKSGFPSGERSFATLLLSAQDDVANACRETAEKLNLNRVGIPVKLGHRLFQLGHKVADTSAWLSEAGRLLRSVSPGYAAEETIRSAEKVQAAQREAQDMAVAALAELHTDETAADPAVVSLLTEIINCLSKAAESASSAADCILCLSSGK